MARYWGERLFTSLIAAVLFGSVAQAAVVDKCLTLMEATGQTASTTGTIYSLPDTDPEAGKALYFTGVRTATNTAGSSPTLDVKIQSCQDKVASACKDTPISFTQCTTSTCTRENIDLNADSVNTFRYYRAVTTIGGTSTPTYTVAVYLCYR